MVKLFTYADETIVIATKEYTAIRKFLVGKKVEKRLSIKIVASNVP